MDQHTISKEAARRFLITKQGFHQGKEKTGTLEAIKRLECIQIDPVNVVHRNHHLVLHSRVVTTNPPIWMRYSTRTERSLNTGVMRNQ